ncbi:MAG TPA: hypothetical protein VFJ58_07575 [Armatimonadota bacterium]|nr:hypothetical protein [Armatimonadota bacterium]
MVHRIRSSPRLALLLLTLVIVSLAALIVRRHVRVDAASKWYDLGVAASSKHNYQEAARDFELSIKNAPAFTPAYDLLAGSRLAMGQPDQALEILDQLRGLRPGDGYVSTRIAETYSDSDNVLAMRWARQAILEAPRSPRAHMLLALGLDRAGNTRDALAEARLAEQLAHSTLLADVIKGNPGIIKQPAQLLLTLHGLVSQVPYE